MNLKKTVPFADAQIKVDEATGRFSGYASVFGGVDSYGDTMVKGAFESTLRLNGKPKMFYEHQWEMPIGKYLKCKEDEHGLFVEGELTNGIQLASDVRAAMLHGTLDGLSIGGFLKKGDYDETETGRVIRKWSHLVEISPVVFPADDEARVDLASVKALGEAIDQIESIREFERFLRDAGSFSKANAQALTARAKTLFSLRDADEQAAAKEKAELLARISRIAS